MALKKMTPREALNKAFLKIRPSRNEMDRFRAGLIALLDRTDESETEEFHKNLVSDFLKKTYYDPKHFINTKGRNDLVIHNGKHAKSSVGVIVEAKKPANKAEMLSQDRINVKAFHELLLYYLRERISGKNLEIRHLIASNIYEWFLFDANVFEKAFVRNKNLVKQFEDFEAGRLAGRTTDFFYNDIAKPAIAEMETEIPFTYFDIRDCESFLSSEDRKDHNQLIPLFKLLSPEHLLKLPFANDSNTLDKAFYSELLHILGLAETKKKGKKRIGRKKAGERDAGSLLENTVTQLDALDKIGRLENPERFGDTDEERLFGVALELIITWTNRILFLKLLEAQLLSYHKGDVSHAFLNVGKIRNFGELNTLFFQVLARERRDRGDDVRTVFDKVPYLNSSLFEPTELEHETLFVSNLSGGKMLPLLSSTVLKDRAGKRLGGEMDTLGYLFRFLEAYDFSSQGAEEIQEESRSLISASVLGLIFEKINGYRDGSFFTPGFVTMYMCRETLRRAVVQKFKERKKWECGTLDDLYDKIEDRDEANEIMNSLRICDPAVGSGHFLVSALNEIIAVKSELRILQDREGRRLKEYRARVENDELVVTDEDGDFFRYRPQNPESQRVQEALFHEKRTLIENCLFGVDVNPNSVKICRLRLWIELLKHAYYKADKELETLPNIDINIRCGNSLISRFGLDADLRPALRKSRRWTIDSYRMAVQSYRQARGGKEKRELKALIAEIKKDFRTGIRKDDPKAKRLDKLGGELYDLLNQQKLFEETAKEKKARERKQKKLEKEIAKLGAEIEERKSGRIYENAFEWRFEFPEVLNDDGDFVGFDVVIGNPPYINAIEFKKQVGDNDYNLYKKSYSTAKGTVDIYIYFFELGAKLLRTDNFLCYITPNRYLSANYGVALREYLINNFNFLRIGDYSDVKVFSEASTYPIITLIQKSKNKNIYKFRSFTYIDERKDFVWREFSSDSLTYLDDNILGFILSSKFPLTKKVIDMSVSMADAGMINATSTAGEAEKFHKLIDENETHGFKLINTGTIDRYSTTWGLKAMTDKGKKFSTPFLPKNKDILGNNRFGLYGKPKIIFAKIALRTEAFFDEDGSYASINTNCMHSFKPEFAPYYILGWLNSRLFQFVFECFFDGLRMAGGYLLYSAPNLNNLCIKKIPIDEQNTISEKVDQILAAKKRDPNADTEALEKEIDRLVYELYDLTEEEIAIVERGV